MIISAAQRAGPFTHTSDSVARTMAWVMVALAPATGYGLWLFGWPAALLFGVTLGSALIAEAAMLALLRQPLRTRLLDGSALLTGWLLALSLPPWAPWWVGALGSAIAIVFGKQLYGGLGQNLFNPAMVARVVLLVSFPVQMTLWVAPAPPGGAQAPTLAQALAITAGTAAVPDHLSAASALGTLKTEHSRGVSMAQASQGLPTPERMAIGDKPGSLGETSAVLVFGGGVLLLLLRVISWHIPVAMLATLAALAALSHGLAPDRYASAQLHLLSGGAMLGAFFIATDYVTSPVSRSGQLLFACGIGGLTWVIRSLGGYPEGLAFAVLIMNGLVPLIDRWLRPRVFGRDRRGRPIALGARR